MEKVIKELAYVPGSIKNHTLFQKEGIRVVVIAISAGDRLKPHSAPVDVLLVGLEGEAQITLSGKWYTIKPNESIQFPANEVHSVEASTNFKMLLIK